MENRELDRAIATEFFGWHIEKSGPRDAYFDADNKPTMWVVSSFKPSSDPAFCALVLDEIERRRWDYDICYWSYRPTDRYRIRIMIPITKTYYKYYASYGDILWHTVCDAALQAAEAEGAEAAA